jgi:ribosomal protein S6
MSKEANGEESTTGSHKNYELAFHIVPSHDDEGAKKVFDTIFKLVEDKGGKVINKSLPVLTNLIYQMEKTVDSVKSKYNRAYFAWIIFGSDDIESLKLELDQNDDLLRYLIIKTDQIDGIKSEEVAVMLSGEEKKEEEPKKEVKEEKKEEKVEQAPEVMESTEEAQDEARASEVADRVDEAIEELVK